MKAIKNEFTVSSTNKDKETFSILKEAEAVTANSLESLLLFITAPSKGQLKQRRWSVISKLMQPKRISCDSQESDSETNEFERVDAVLQLLISSKPSSIENFQKHVQNLELCIEDIEVGVESLSRQLIRTRVSLLNILNH